MKMLKSIPVYVAFLVTMALLPSCKNEPQVNAVDEKNQEVSSSGKVKYTLNPDGRKWKIINNNTQEQMSMTQYILENQDPENVTELFTITEMSDVSITPPDYFSQFITELQRRYSNAKVESKIISQKTDSLFGEWWVDGKSPDTTQHEWIRIIKKGNDIAVLRYSTNKADNLDKSRKAWESILNNASFK